MSDWTENEEWWAGEDWDPRVKRMIKHAGKVFSLSGETIKPITNTRDISKAFDINNRRVAYKDFGNGTSISTVFLCIDHNMGDSETPILFETMAWYKGEEYEQRRYPTVEAALTGHKEILDSLEIAVKNSI